MKILTFFLLSIYCSQSLCAIDVAPKISDREVIESLARLETTLKMSIEQNKLMHEVSTKDRRYLDEKFNQRMSFIENLLIAILGGIMGLIAFIIWDRNSAMKPLEKKIDALERDLQHDLELQNPEGSRLTRLIHAFRELAQTNPEISKTLKAFSLL